MPCHDNSEKRHRDHLQSLHTARVVASSNCGAQIIDPQTGECQNQIIAFCTAMDYTRDGTTIVTANRTGVAIRDSPSGQLTRRIQTYVHGPSDLRISGDGKHLYICGEDSTVDKYSLAGGATRA